MTKFGVFWRQHILKLESFACGTRALAMFTITAPPAGSPKTHRLKRAGSLIVSEVFRGQSSQEIWCAFQNVNGVDVFRSHRTPIK